jgi:hypothetical protein
MPLNENDIEYTYNAWKSRLDTSLEICRKFPRGIPTRHAAYLEFLECLAEAFNEGNMCADFSNMGGRDKRSLKQYLKEMGHMAADKGTAKVSYTLDGYPENKTDEDIKKAVWATVDEIPEFGTSRLKSIGAKREKEDRGTVTPVLKVSKSFVSTKDFIAALIKLDENLIAEHPDCKIREVKLSDVDAGWKKQEITIRPLNQVDGKDVTHAMILKEYPEMLEKVKEELIAEKAMKEKPPIDSIKCLLEFVITKDDSSELKVTFSVEKGIYNNRSRDMDMVFARFGTHLCKYGPVDDNSPLD